MTVQNPTDPRDPKLAPYEPPRFEVIVRECEISAYAPAGVTGPSVAPAFRPREASPAAGRS